MFGELAEKVRREIVLLDVIDPQQEFVLFREIVQEFVLEGQDAVKDLRGRGPVFCICCGFFSLQIQGLFADQETLSAMKESTRAMARQDAAESIAEQLWLMARLRAARTSSPFSGGEKENRTQP